MPISLSPQSVPPPGVPAFMPPARGRPPPGPYGLPPPAALFPPPSSNFGARTGSNRIAQNLSIVLQIGRLTGVTWRGWGTSLAWFANFVGGLPSDQLIFILDKLFDRNKGLGLNIVRYILPGGLNRANSPLLASLPFQTAPYGFQPYPRRPYDWTADFNQRAVLAGALRRRAIAEAISYSPPWWMTINGDVSGNADGQPNLDQKHIPAFVTYLADVLEHFAREWNIRFVGFNPFNEPLQKWWRSGGNQEGCAFSVESMSEVLTRMREALDSRGLNATQLVGLDDWALPTKNALGQKPEIWSLISRLALHGYRYPTYVNFPSRNQMRLLQNVQKMAQDVNKEVWLTEWGPQLPVPANPTDLDLALVLARNVIELTNVLRISVFMHWQAVVPKPPYFPRPFAPRVGLIRLRFNYSVPFDPEITKQYYVQLHFSRFMEPGSKLLAVPVGLSRLVLVSYNRFRRWLSIFAINQKPAPSVLRIAAPRGVRIRSQSGYLAEVYRTSATESCRRVFRGAIPPSFSGRRGIRLLPGSLTTIVFKNITLQPLPPRVV